jgi:hypothetical protein
METTTERLSRELVLLQRIEFRSMVRSGLIPEDTEEAFREWLGEHERKDMTDNKEFKEAIYELAFGDNAINRGFSEEEVIATIKGFTHDSWVAEESENVCDMSEAKTYEVGIHFEEGHVLTVQAESEEVAKEIAMDAVHDCGGTEYPKKFNPCCGHRDFCVTHIEEQDQ